MAYVPLHVEQFGGLNLTNAPDEVGGSCIDVLNCDFDDRGTVRSRDGYDNFTSSEGTNRYDSLTPFYTSSGTKQIVAGAGNRLEAITAAGAVSVSSTSPTASPHYFSRFAAPGSEHLYIANGTDTVRRWDGTAFSTPAYTGTTPTGMFLAVQATDNRLVNARTSAQVSRVLFSDAGVPTTFGANNYVDLHPGDGETIMALASWRELLFVFKETKFFVFYGNSTDTSANPVFNYRPMDFGVGVIAPGAAAVARDGVYFVSREGVFHTAGGKPELVSEPIDPLFRGGASEFFDSDEINDAQVDNAQITFHNERVYAAITTGAATVNNLMLVHDPRYGYWTVWDIPAAALGEFRPGDDEELVFAYASGLKHIGRHSDAYTDDDGTAITSRYRSGFSEPADGAESVIRETILQGVGTVTYGLSVDYGSVPTAGGGAEASVTLGTSPNVDEGRHRVAQKGRRFSWRARSTTAWTLHKLTHHVRGARPVSAKTS